MEWTLRFSQIREILIDRAIDSDDGEIPAALEEEPELSEPLARISELFWWLSSRRQIVVGGMGAPMPRPLSVQDIWTVAPEWGIDPGHFLRVTGEGDALYIDHLARQSTRSMKGKR